MLINDLKALKLVLEAAIRQRRVDSFVSNTSKFVATDERILTISGLTTRRCRLCHLIILFFFLSKRGSCSSFDDLFYSCRISQNYVFEDFFCSFISCSCLCFVFHAIFTNVKMTCRVARIQQLGIVVLFCVHLRLLY